ncbi:MAG: (2Fe-2S) ferredoxin domain-containing protein [Thermomicrobiales bacterium]
MAEFGHKRRETLDDALRAALKEAGHGRDVRVLSTKCLGLCPKNAVVVLNGARPEALHAVPAGTDVAEALACLAGTPNPGRAPT